MESWGRTREDNPVKFPAPTILDFEVTTKCTGVGGVLCPFCYKANNPNGKNLSFENFKKIFDKLPRSITQIAFGADSKCMTNPDIWDMMLYAKDKGVIPNITVAELDKETACKLASICGAVAVSRYHNPDICYNSVKYLADCGLKQVNIHYMIAEETYDRAVQTIKDAATDERLKDLNAIVFLSLKTKGRGEHFHPLSQAKFDSLVNLCNELNISYGFDSCSSLKYFRSLSDKEYKLYSGYVQPCESTLESSYINVDGEFFPCSFTEGTQGWEKGISVLDCDNFVDDVWNNPRTEEFRNRLLGSTCKNRFGCRECPIYTI
jgi:radical SAM protein with 4Fe4S-binding SPASM domain